ncbi:cytochrome P450 [Hypoxylon sp. FL1150]|nr:cytochrome P450 [Hypoxylon sp. FL1150]
MGTTLDYVALSAAALLLYGLGLVTYRLYVSPFAKFPGPRLAAATHWYQRYFDLVAKGTGGQFVLEIKRMHEKYGPIVRIAPDELHIDDPNYWSEVYCNSTTAKPIDKQAKLRYRFGVPDAVFSTPLAEQHRRRRQAMAPFFSKQRLRKLNDRVNGLMESVSHRLSTEYAGTGLVLNVADMFSCMTVDIVTDLAFNRSTNCSAAPDFNAPLLGATASTLWASHWNAHFRIVRQVMDSLPDRLLGNVLPLFRPILELRAGIVQQVNEILSDMEEGKKRKALEDVDDQAPHPTIFNDILASDLPPQELSFDRLTQDAFAITSAGMETTKSTLTLAVFYVLDQPETHSRLKAELASAMPDPNVILPWVELEKLPFLSAVIYESLRLSYGSVQRSPRINRLHPWKFGAWVIPPGTAVGMDAYHMHTNEDIFPDPLAFCPTRWLGDPKGPDGRQPLLNYLCSFGGGSRICIAMHLAYMELYVFLATLFRRHELQLYETDKSDVEFALEMLAPMPHWGSRGVRVTVDR